MKSRQQPTALERAEEERRLMTDTAHSYALFDVVATARLTGRSRRTISHLITTGQLTPFWQNEHWPREYLIAAPEVRRLRDTPKSRTGRKPKKETA